MREKAGRRMGVLALLTGLAAVVTSNTQAGLMGVSEAIIALAWTIETRRDAS